MKTRFFLCFVLLTACGDDDGPTSDAGSDAMSETCTSDDECADEFFCNGLEACSPGDPGASSMGCVLADSPCMADQMCDEAADECVTMCAVTADADGDGVDALECGGTDCDDSNANRFPGNTEVCDADDVDEDCDPATLGNRDADSDGVIDIACCNGDRCGADCDDGRAGVFPGATEGCNERDDDCDGTVDEDVPTSTYYPDCDRDGFGDETGESMVACSTPEDAPAACPAGEWTTATGDCADDMMSVNPGNPEVCNAVDDDCDGLTDDIMDGVVVCESGETMASCTNVCGVEGTGTCAPDCLGFDCSSAEFETCNYCDDDGDGNIFGEKALATRDEVYDFNCATATSPVFGNTTCETTDGPGGSFLLEAVILDGTSNDSAGALWLTPSDWFVGWGPVEIEVILKVRARPTGGGGAEVPLGGWSLAMARGGTPGVGSPQNLGLPNTIDGLSVNWYWSTPDTCFRPDNPPDSFDSVRLYRQQDGFGGRGLRSDRTASIPTSWNCAPGDGLNGGSTGFNGQTTFVEQRVRLRYIPDDPTTATPNEERVEILAQSPAGSGPASTYIYDADDTWSERPMDEMPIGSPLQIGVTAGTYTQSGFTGPPPSLVFGVPVEARIELWVFIPPMGPGEVPMFTNQEASVSLERLCPLP